MINFNQLSLPAYLVSLIIENRTSERTFGVVRACEVRSFGDDGAVERFLVGRGFLLI